MTLVYDYRDLTLKYMQVNEQAGLAYDGVQWLRCFQGFVGSTWMWIIGD